MVSGSPVVLTIDGMQRLQDALRVLRERRATLIEALSASVDGGGMQSDLGLTERRIAEIQDVLARAMPLDATERVPGVVGIGSRVTVRWEGDGDETYTIRRAGRSRGPRRPHLLRVPCRSVAAGSPRRGAGVGGNARRPGPSRRLGHRIGSRHGQKVLRGGDTSTRTVAMCDVRRPNPLATRRPSRSDVLLRRLCARRSVLLLVRPAAAR